MTLSSDERLRLERAWYWQAMYQERAAVPEIALTYFVAAMRGNHPPGLPGMTEGEW